ncbi:hypothetical protein CALVIDRAFT_596408, partial [Calocera viscosa TUFC12733]
MGAMVSPDSWKTLHITPGHALADEFLVNKMSFQLNSKPLRDSTRAQPPEKGWLARMVNLLTPDTVLVPANESTNFATTWINENLYSDHATPTAKMFADQNRLQFLPAYVTVQWYLWWPNDKDEQLLLPNVQQAEIVLKTARKKSGYKPEVFLRGYLEFKSAAASKRNNLQNTNPPKVTRRVSVKTRALKQTILRGKASKASIVTAGTAKRRAAADKKATSRATKTTSLSAPITAKRGKRARDDNDASDEDSPPAKRTKGSAVVTSARRVIRPQASRALYPPDDTVVPGRNGAKGSDPTDVSMTDDNQADTVSPERRPRKRMNLIQKLLEQAWLKRRLRGNQLFQKFEAHLDQHVGNFADATFDWQRPLAAETGSSMPMTAPPDSSDNSSRQQGNKSSAMPDTRPLIEYRPPIWAFGRQAICESLPYFRSTESGCYFKGNIARGYLVDGFPSERDMWGSDGRVIVSHGGGKSRRDDDGNVELESDQKEDDARIRALINTMRHKAPIVLLVGRKSQLPPWRMECDYAVLGYYIIVNCWVEMESERRVNRFKFKFQWLPCQGEPWWLAGEHVPGGWSPTVNDRKELEAKRLQQAAKKQLSELAEVKQLSEAPVLTAPTIGEVPGTGIEPQLSGLVSFEDHDQNAVETHHTLIKRLGISKMEEIEEPTWLSLGAAEIFPSLPEEASLTPSTLGMTLAPSALEEANPAPSTLDSAPIPSAPEEGTLTASMLNAPLPRCTPEEATLTPSTLDLTLLPSPSDDDPFPSLTVDMVTEEILSDNKAGLRLPLILSDQPSMRDDSRPASTLSPSREACPVVDDVFAVQAKHDHDVSTVQRSRSANQRLLPAVNHDELCELFPPVDKGDTYVAQWFGYGPTYHCQACGLNSPAVYTIGDVCLNPDCRDAFWKVFTQLGYHCIPAHTRLEFHPDFLDCVPITGAWDLPDLAPPPPMSAEQLQRGMNTTRAGWRGWHCKDCGRLNQRRSFRGWSCRECGRTLIPGPARHDVGFLKNCVTRYGVAACQMDSECVVRGGQYLALGGRYLVTRYELADCGSTIYHLRPQVPVGVDDPADDLFHKLLREMQEHDLLHRFPAKHNLLRGESLSQHFLCNAGTHYKYITDTSTTPFEKCPPSMMEARKILYDAAQEVIQEDPMFNELLTVAYMDEQKMAVSRLQFVRTRLTASSQYHDDGEDGLGPVVASLSLGSPALMSFRA